MMNIYVELLLVSAVVVFVIDLSGVVESVKDALSRWLNGRVRRLRPFDCDLCMVWWVTLLWALIRGEFSLPIVAYSAGLAFMATTIKDVLLFVKELLGALIDLLYKMIGR